MRCKRKFGGADFQVFLFCSLRLLPMPQASVPLVVELSVMVTLVMAVVSVKPKYSAPPLTGIGTLSVSGAVSVNVMSREAVKTVCSPVMNVPTACVGVAEFSVVTSPEVPRNWPPPGVVLKPYRLPNVVLLTPEKPFPKSEPVRVIDNPGAAAMGE